MGSDREVGPLITTLVPQDHGDRIAPQGTFAPLGIDNGKQLNSLLDNPIEAQLEMAAGQQPTATNTKGDGFSGFGKFLSGSWIYLAVSAAVIVALVIALTRNSSKSTPKAPQNLTQAQAATAQAQLDQQLTIGSQLLKSEGYSADTIAQSRNQVKIVYGSQIALAEHSTNRLDKLSALYTTGDYGPSHYANLVNIDAKAYVNSLSASPTSKDLAANSAAVHGLEVVPAQ